jgi:hypothetical protein
MIAGEWVGAIHDGQPGKQVGRPCTADWEVDPQVTGRCPEDGRLEPIKPVAAVRHKAIEPD